MMNKKSREVGGNPKIIKNRTSSDTMSGVKTAQN